MLYDLYNLVLIFLNKSMSLKHDMCVLTYENMLF